MEKREHFRRNYERRAFRVADLFGNGGWVGTFVRMCVSNFLFTLGLLPRIEVFKGLN